MPSRSNTRVPSDPRPTTALRALVLAAGLALAGPVAAQTAAPPGQALYETRCIACHDRSVHRRESRRAQDFASLRREVLRWSTTAGTDWRADEVDAVTVFLNDRYYRFACPPSTCPAAPRAQAMR